jgi:hypothetical protein
MPMLRRRTAIAGQEPGVAKARRSDDAWMLDRIALRDMRAFEDLYRSYHPA